MRAPVLAAELLLAPWPSALLAVPVLALVGLVVAREALRLLDPDAPALGPVSRAARVLTPVVLAVLALRLVVILQ